jgi:hypothetical protein
VLAQKVLRDQKVPRDLLDLPDPLDLLDRKGPKVRQARPAWTLKWAT